MPSRIFKNIQQNPFRCSSNAILAVKQLVYVNQLYKSQWHDISSETKHVSNPLTIDNASQHKNSVAMQLLYRLVEYVTKLRHFQLVHRVDH